MDLNINYQETRNIGNQVQSKAAEFESLLTKIKNVNSQISQVWSGDDASKYYATVTEQMRIMEQLKRTIDEVGVFLVKVGNAYETAAQDNASAIKLG